MSRSLPTETESRAAVLAPELRRRLLGIYDSGGRDLPWRRETDPYGVWVSEIMLQQTRVATVIPYYKAWMGRFPDLASLAGAREEDVLRAWQGLGYYSRARNLRLGAQAVRERFGGELPSSPVDLKTLPGVGEYTAGAVASIAFGEVVPVVDGNVRRVLSRLFDLPDPKPGELMTLATELVDPGRPGDFNQALMEFGATRCTPLSPDCDLCPLEGLCLARERDTVEDRPRRKRRKPVPEVVLRVLVAVREPAGAPRRLLLRKRPDRGLLAGMWEFPVLEVEEEEEEGGEGGIPLPEMTHQFTHLKHRYRPSLLLLGEEGGPVPGGAELLGRWVTPEEMKALPMPVAQRKMAEGALRFLEARNPPPSSRR